MNHSIKAARKQIKLTGNMSADRLDEIKESLLAELYNQQRLDIVISDVTTLHLSTLQWIYAFGCAASSEGKEVAVTTDLPAKYDKLVRASGIKKMFNRFNP